MPNVKRCSAPDAVHRIQGTRERNVVSYQFEREDRDVDVIVLSGPGDAREFVRAYLVDRGASAPVEAATEDGFDDQMIGGGGGANADADIDFPER